MDVVVCDATASYAKKAIIISQMDTSIAIRSPEEVIPKIAALKNHVADQVITSTTDFSVSTLKGIRKFFKFTADKHKDWIYCFL